MSNLITIKENFGDSDKNGKKWEDYDTIVCPDGQIIDMVKLLDDQQRAKAALLHIMPFFGGFIGKLQPIYTFMIPTQAVDGVHLFINPQFTYNLDLTGKVFVLAHEIMHCVLNHLRRGHNHDQERSNIAADFEVNITLADIGLITKDRIKKIGGLIDDKYSGWGYEKIYNSSPSIPSSEDMNNEEEANKASKNAESNGSGGSGSKGNNQKQEFSDDYKKGWNQAMEDYKNGKLKL